MQKKLSAKINAPEILERQLRRRARKGEYGIIALSTSTEPYMKIEEKLQLTRKILKVILKYRFPVHILTKSNLVLRDLDLLEEIDNIAILPEDLANKMTHGAIITFSISTLNNDLAKILEPGAPSPQERLETMKECKKKKFLTGIAFIPVLPFLSDSERNLAMMIRTAKEYGADYVFVGALTLFGNKPADNKVLYYKFLKQNYPELVPKYKSLYRIFFTPSKEYQKELEEKSERLCNKYKIKNRII